MAAPEIAIEILSRGSENIARDRVAKRQLYSKHGVKEYWIVDSETRTIEIYRLAGASLELSAKLKDNDLVTSQLLPAFGFAASEAFKQ